jgi:hypothetical protein
MFDKRQSTLLYFISKNTSKQSKAWFIAEWTILLNESQVKHTCFYFLLLNSCTCLSNSSRSSMSNSFIFLFSVCFYQVGFIFSLIFTICIGVLLNLMSICIILMLCGLISSSSTMWIKITYVICYFISYYNITTYTGFNRYYIF